MIWRVEPVAPNDVPKLWRLAVPHLLEAVQHSNGRTDMRAVFDSCRVETSVLWLIYDEAYGVHAAFVTRVAKYARKAILSVDFLGGEGMADWLPAMLEVLDRYRSDAGLAGIEAVGRAGWARVLKRFGWQESFAVVAKLV